MSLTAAAKKQALAKATELGLAVPSRASLDTLNALINEHDAKWVNPLVELQAEQERKREAAAFAKEQQREAKRAEQQRQREADALAKQQEHEAKQAAKAAERALKEAELAQQAEQEAEAKREAKAAKRALKEAELARKAKEDAEAKQAAKAAKEAELTRQAEEKAAAEAEAERRKAIAAEIEMVAPYVARACYTMSSAVDHRSRETRGALEEYAEELADSGVLVRFVTADGEPALTGAFGPAPPRSGYFVYNGEPAALFRYIMEHPGTGFNEVVRHGQGRKLFFDVDGLAMEDPSEYAELLREIVLDVVEADERTWDWNIFKYDLYTSDVECKGFHMMFGQYHSFTARVVQEIYKRVRAALKTRAEGGCAHSAALLEGAVLDPAPSNNQFNMRMLGSFKVTQTDTARTRQARQKLLHESLTRDEPNAAWEYEELEGDVFPRSIISAKASSGRVLDLEDMEMDTPEEEEQGEISTDAAQLEELLKRAKHVKSWKVELADKHGFKLTPGHSDGHDCPVCKRKHDKQHVWAVGPGLHSSTGPVVVICQRAPRGERTIEVIDQRAYLAREPTGVNAEYTRYLLENNVQTDGGVWWKQVEANITHGQDLTLAKPLATSCPCCETKTATEYIPAIHTTVNHLYATGKGLCTPTSSVTLRCKNAPAGKNTVRVFGGVSTAVPVDAPKPPTPPAQGPPLRHQYTLDGFHGRMTRTTLKDFLEPQLVKHVRHARETLKHTEKEATAAARLSRTMFIERALAQQAYEDQVAAWMKQVEKHADGAEASFVTDFSRVRAAIATIDSAGVDMDVYGAKTFGLLDKVTYADEVALLSAIHANLWVVGNDAQATYEGEWTSYPYVTHSAQLSRNRMRFRVKEVAESYGGAKFWEEIHNVFTRLTLPRFTPLAATARRVSQLQMALNSYGGRASTGHLAHRDPAKYDDHVRAFTELFDHQIAGEGEVYAEYALNWFAWIAQRPHLKTSVALLIHGPQGSGKSMLLTLMNYIIPHAGYCANTGLDTLTDKFNSDLDGKALYMVAEAPESLTHDRAASACLKGLIADKVMLIQNKCKDRRRVPQYLNFVLASNMVNCVHTDEKDRRWCLLYNQEPTYSFGDTEYFGMMWDLVNDVTFQANVQEYLYTRDITNFDPSKFPRSPALRATKLTSPLVDFALRTPDLAARVRDEILLADRTCTLRDIVDLYIRAEGIEHANRQKLEHELFHALINGSGLRERFVIHPDAEDDRLIVDGITYTYPVAFSGDAPSRKVIFTDEQRAVVAEMIARLTALGDDTSKFTQVFSASHSDVYQSMTIHKLIDLAQARGLPATRRTPKAKVIELLRADDVKKAQ